MIKLGEETLYYPADEKAVLDNINLSLELNTAGSLSFLCPPNNPCYDKLFNRQSIVRVFRDNKEIFTGEIREQSKDLWGNKKVSCVGLLAYLADSIQPQKEYHNQTPYQLLEKFLHQHNEQVEKRKRIQLGRVTVTDPNNSLYRFTNYETTLQAITEKLISKLGGYLLLRKENEKLVLDYLRLEEMGKLSRQKIELAENLLDYTEDISAEDIATAVIPLGKEIEDREKEHSILRKYTDICLVNNGKNYLVSKEAKDRFGWVCKVVRFEDVTVPSNLLRKGSEWLRDHQFEMMELSLSAVDLREFAVDEETIDCGDRVRCVAPIFGMDRVFPVLSKSIPINRPAEMKLVLGTRQQKGYVQSSSKAIQTLREEGLATRKLDNERVESAINNLKAKMNLSTGGYKISEYDDSGRWLRDLYMDTPDKKTARKVLQVNMNGVAGSHNGYEGPYNAALTLDGMIYGDRIIGHSIDAEKLAVSYTSQVEQKINEAKEEAVKESSKKLEDYYTIREINTKLKTTERKIEASVETVNLKLEQKNGNYYGSYVPNNARAPENSWISDTERMHHVGDFFYDTTTGYAYRYVVKKEGLELVFSDESRTGSERYDWVEIFYELDGKIYVLPKCGGTSIAGQKLFIPTSKFWLYFRTDVSNQDYYGFKIDSIRKAPERGEITGTLSSLPKDAGEAIKLSDYAYPESEHFPYQASVRKLWLYDTKENIDSHLYFDWVRVKDKDIEAAKEKADTAISKVSIMEDSIQTMVKKGDFGTFMQQNYYSFLLGFNNASSYVQITPGAISLYNGAVDDQHKRARFDENGNNFYRDGSFIGKIGTNVWNENNTHKGLVFDLDVDGKYMAFSEKSNPDEGIYKTMLCFSRSGSIYADYGIHIGCNLYTHGFKVVDPQWNDGYGITATINYVQVLDVNSDGTVERWGKDGRMVFKNGILMDLSYYT